jgi:NADH:ubiquinone oxidoreductase subunit C
MREAEARLRERFPEAECYRHNENRLYIRIPRERLTDACRFLHQERGMRLAICTGIDTREGFEVLYHFSDDDNGGLYTLKVVAPKDDPRIDSQAAWFPSTDWIEREMHELLGVEFPGHPDMQPLLTSDTDWDPDKKPLRRDYERRAEKHGR